MVVQGCAAAVKDRDGCTPLYCAAAWNQVEAVRQLDRLGCPSWQKSLEGRTPVHVAAEQGWVDLIDLLVKELKNKVGCKPCCREAWDAGVLLVGIRRVPT